MTGLITPATGAAHARIAGIGAYRPRRVVPNSEIVEAIDSSDEWIQERSGIKTRHFAGEGESVIDMSEAAVNGALEMAGMEAGEIDAVLADTAAVRLREQIEAEAEAELAADSTEEDKA